MINSGDIRGSQIKEYRYYWAYTNCKLYEFKLKPLELFFMITS